MKRSYVIAGLLAIGTAGWIISGQMGHSSGNLPEGQKAPANLQAEQKLMQVRVQTVKAEPRTAIQVARGRTEAFRTVVVKTETYGSITELNATRGDRVEEGQVIARLAPEDRTAKLDEAKALRVQRQIEYDASKKLSQKGFRSQTQVAAAEAVLEAAEAAVDAAEVALENIVIRAPFDGTVYDTIAEMGDFIETGDGILNVVDLDPILVVADVNEREVGMLQIGQTGQARLVNGTTMEGKLSFISSVADPATRTFRVELQVPNAENKIADGLTAELYLPTIEVPVHQVSPAVLTLSDNGDVGVKILRADNIVMFHPVEIVDSDEKGVWISGLPETSVLITVGQEYVRDGQKVIPVDEQTLEPMAKGTTS